MSKLTKRCLSIALVIAICFAIGPFAKTVVLTRAESNNSSTNYTVLILDTSYSMEGTPFEAEKDAAKLFCESITKSNDSYVAIIEMYGYAYVRSHFTNDVESLKQSIDDIYLGSSTNISSSIETATDMLNNIDSDGSISRNIVLCSDGLPNEGASSTEGPYNENDSVGEYSYTYANSADNAATAAKDTGISIYTLGFFHSLTGDEEIFGKTVMHNLQNAGYYDVNNPSDLDYSFIGIANEVLNPDNLDIAVKSSSASFNMLKKQTISLSFALVEDGTVLSWNNMAVSISNPDVISISNYKTNSMPYSDSVEYSISVTAKQPGSSFINISDPKTGVSKAVKINVTDGSGARMYNIYHPLGGSSKGFVGSEINGVYFDNYSVSNDNDYYTVRMNAYNWNYYNCAIDIFDKNGKYYGSEEIKRFSNPHSLKEVGQQYGHLFTDLKTGKFYSYNSEVGCQHSKLEFKVPQGGYYTISNNVADSKGTLIYNLIDITFDLISEGGGLKKDSPGEDSFKQAFIKAAVKNGEKTLWKLWTKEAKAIATNKNIKEKGEGYFGLFESFCKTIDFDWKKEAVSYGIATSKKALNVSTGWIGAILESIAIIDTIRSICDLDNSLSYLTYTFFTDTYEANPKAKESFKNEGIIVEQNDEAIPNVVVQAFRVYDDSEFSESQFSEKEIYNISLIENDKTVQPSGMVKVYMPIPDGLKRETCSVYRKESDESWTKLDAVIEGNYLVFETDHFSLYAITGKTGTLSITKMPNKTNYNIFDELNLDGLEVRFDGKVINENFNCYPCVLNDFGDCIIKVLYDHAETSFTVHVKKDGFVYDSDGIIRYYKDDKVDTSVNDVMKDEVTTNWYNVVNGVVTPGPTIAKNSYGWWYIDRYGKVDFTANGIYKNKFGWWKTTDGKVTFKETGVFKNDYGWWRVKDSKVDFKANDIYKNANGWWKTTDGKVTFKENGVFKNDYGWWKVKNSKVDFGYTGVAKNKYGWWRIEKGKVNFKFTGIAKNEYGTWYIKDGKVDFKKNGKVKYNEKTYRVTDGKAKLA